MSKTTVNPLRKKDPYHGKKTPIMVTDLTYNCKISFVVLSACITCKACKALAVLKKPPKKLSQKVTPKIDPKKWPQKVTQKMTQKVTQNMTHGSNDPWPEVFGHGGGGGLKKKTLFICHQKVPPQSSPAFFSIFRNRQPPRGFPTRIPIWENFGNVVGPFRNLDRPYSEFHVHPRDI